MYRFLLLFFLFSSLLFAEEEKVPYLTSECDTFSLVEGVVNAYNGNLVQIDQDIKMRGIDPLEMTRFYDGGHHFDSEFGYGVGCAYPALLLFSKVNDKYYAEIELRQGLDVLCELKRNKKFFTGSIAKSYYKSGYTNSCSSLLQGEPSLAAMHVEINVDGANVTLGDGTKRHYRLFAKEMYQGDYYRLEREELPNGNQRHFSYLGKSFPFRLERIWTTNHDSSLTLNWLEFSLNGNLIFIKSSTGQHARYTMTMVKGKVKKGNFFHNVEGRYSKAIISDASSTENPTTCYEVIKHSDTFSTVFSLSKVKLPNGRFLEVEYDNFHRVTKLKASGYDQPIHTFTYKPNLTLVTDARGATKSYEFNLRHLIRVKDEYRVLTYGWDDKGQLKNHMIFTSKNKLVYNRDYKYDTLGNIVEIDTKGEITRKGSVDTDITRFTYGERNKLTNKIHNNAVQTKFEYVPNTNLVARELTLINDEIVERTFYEYDINSILIRKIVDDGCNQDHDDLTNVSYRLITEIEPQLNPNLFGMTLPRRQSEWYQEHEQKHLLKRTEYTYTKGDLVAEERIYDADNVYRYKMSYDYNEHAELLRETNALGEVTIYDYDANGNKIYEEKIGSGKKTQFIYDLANRLIEEKEEHGVQCFSKTYSYDAVGNLINETDIYGQKSLYQYDSISRQISSEDARGNIESKEYDSFNNVTKNIDKDGHAINTCYNIFGKPFEINYPDATTEKFAYNTLGHLVQEWKRDDTNIRYQVDYKGRITQAETYSPDGILLKIITYKYKGPNLIVEADALGNETRYSYDGAGRKIAKNQGNITTYYEYDTLGRLTKTTINDHVRIKEFDHADRVLEERVEDTQGNTYSKVQYTYDIHGNQTIRRNFESASHCTESQTFYNSQNLPILIKDALGFERKIAYLQGDHLETTTIDPLGRRIVEIFDPLQRLEEVKTISEENILLARYLITYDGRGNQVTRTDDILMDGISIGKYLVETAFDAMNQKIQETEQSIKTTKWNYKEGRLDSLTTPDGIVITHSYDPLGRLQELISSDETIHYRYSYDLNNNLIFAEDLITQTALLRGYDSLQRMVYEKQAAGFEFYFVHDQLNRITEMRFCDGSIVYNYSPTALIATSRFIDGKLLYTYTQESNWHGKVINATLANSLFSYKWDAMGRCQQITAPFYSQKLTYDSVGNLVQTNVEDALGSYESIFSYDGLDQLIHETSPFANQYSYDSLQNRLIKDRILMRIDSLNQLTNDGTDSYSYDPNGRRLTKGDASYRYDALGRLIAYTKDTYDIAYSYDPLGRRIKRTSSDSSVDYLYQMDAEIGCWDKGLLEFRLIANRQSTIAIEMKGIFYIPIRNHRGDIVQLLNTLNTPEATYRYDAFGNCTNEGTTSPWLFFGQRCESTTNLYHFENREYDPISGKWLTCDPLGFVDGPNLYAYVHNNPLAYVDPYGLWREEVNDFCRSFARGAVDDTTWDVSSYALGEYKLSTGYHRGGYYAGAVASMTVSFLYGGAEAKLAKGAIQIAKRSFIKAAPAQTTQMTKLTFKAAKTVQQTKVQKVLKDTITTNEIPHIPFNPLHEIRYSRKVLGQMEKNLKTGQTDFHGFPRLVDNYAYLGRSELLKGKDGLNRVKVNLDGGYKGREGRFEWIIEPNKSVNHRLFIPNR